MKKESFQIGSGVRVSQKNKNVTILEFTHTDYRSPRHTVHTNLIFLIATMTVTIQMQYHFVQTDKTNDDIVSKPLLTPPNASRKRQRNRVTFKESVRIRRTTSYKDYTPEEARATWYSPEEFKSMKKEVRDTIRLIESNSKFDEVLYCKRGVERYTMEGAKGRKHSKLTAFNIVMDKQDECLDIYGTENDLTVEAIAKAYSSATIACKKAAHLAGLSDERCVHLSSNNIASEILTSSASTSRLGNSLVSTAA